MSKHRELTALIGIRLDADGEAVRVVIDHQHTETPKAA
jgi:hypothetical protein